MSFSLYRHFSLLVLVMVGLGACSTGEIGEKVSGETFIARGGSGLAVMRNPTDGAVLTSRFGKRKHPISGKVNPHRGIDLAAPTGTPVLAAADGTIFYQGEGGSFGNLIKIQHNNHVITSYAHLNGFEPDLSAGMLVEKGQVIGFIGTTGRSSGPHLHYELAVDGQQIDPLGLTGSQITEDVNRGIEEAVTGVGTLVQQIHQSFTSTEPTK